MANIQQTVIIRTDLFNLPEDIGLLAAQVAHIHFEPSRKILDDGICEKGVISADIGDAVPILNDAVHYRNWLKEPYLLVKKVGNRESLEYFLKKAKEIELPVKEWRDTMYVRLTPTKQEAFSNVLVGISLGPADADKIRTVVGDLPLLS